MSSRATSAATRILKEVEAGRGSPHGGVYLSFQHCSGSRVARRVRAGDRPARRQRHRSHQNAGRGGADRALPHGRHRGRRADADRICPACSRPAKRSAAPMAPTACPATPSPRRWCSAARAGRSAAAACRSGRDARPIAPTTPARRSIWIAADRARRDLNTAEMMQTLAGDDARRCRAAARRSQAQARA